MIVLTAREVAAALNERIADLACELFGEPNRDLSSAQQLRFGSHGSVAVEITGDKAGCWFDHEGKIGGDGLEMIKLQRGYANGAALDWARQWLGSRPAHPPRGKVLAVTPPLASKDNVALGLRRVAPDLVPEPAAAPPENVAAVGGASDSRPVSGVDAPVSRGAKRAPQDPKRAAKVAAIVARTEDPHDTCVELYLRRRGITKLPLPPSVRYLPNAYSQYGALVALATDEAGQVHGLQLIYLTDDGQKAPLKVQKRTIKAHDGWSSVSAVRMPGGTPLVLCEGVETALSVWQATGQETWACLGISNIARAPVRQGAAVIIARDGDEPNSKADQQVRHAVTVLSSQGHDVTIAEPPSGQDFNDVLQGDGDDAVRLQFVATRPAAALSDQWRQDLLVNKKGKAHPILANAITALRGAPEWQGVLWHNAFATLTVARKPPPWMDRAIS